MDKALVNNNFKDIVTFLKKDYEAYKEKSRAKMSLLFKYSVYLWKK